MTTEERHQVFVYGTLKRHYGNHYRISDGGSLFRGQATIKGLMFHIGGFPAVNLEEPWIEITGEVFDVSDKVLKSLDYLEGYPNHYDRQVIETPFGKAWIYVYTRKRIHEGMYVIPNGLWVGPTSPRIVWAGWGKGFVIGSLDKAEHDPPMTQAKTPWRLIPAEDNWLKLLNITTGEVEGKYRLLGDLIRHIRVNSYKPRPPYNPPPRQTTIEDRRLPVLAVHTKDEKKEDSRPTVNDLGVTFEQVPKE